MWLFGCGGKQNLKGKHSLQVFDKFAKEQHHLYAKKGTQSNDSLVQRMPNSNALSTFKTPASTKEFYNFMSGNLSSLVKKKVLKSEYDALIQKYKNSENLWTDKDFSPNDESWGYIDRPVQWKRISQIMPNAKFAQNNFSPGDIIQGQTGDCYFLSSVAGIAQKPHRIKKIFPNCSINKNGIYMAKLMHKGVYQQVVVDDYVPLNPEDGSFQGAKPAGGNQIWVMILQKCWAKLCGSYQKFEGGVPDEVLRALSSAPTYNYPVVKDQQYLQTLWQKILQAELKNQIICCGSASEFQGQDWMTIGIVPGHAYTVLSVYEGTNRLLKIRNPWGKENIFQWTGRANEKDKKFWSKISSQQKKRMGFGIEDDGVFFMLWEDFSKYFILLTISEFDDNAHYFYRTETFSKKKPIIYVIESEGGKVTFVVSQKSYRALNQAKGQKLAKATLILSKVNQSQDCFQYMASKTETNFSELYLSYDLPKGKYAICSYLQGNEKQLYGAVSAYTQKNTSFLKSSINQEDFLHLVFLDYAQNSNNKNILSQNPLQWCTWDYVQKSKIGFFAIHLDTKSTKKAALIIEQSQLQENGFQLLPPNDGVGRLETVCEIGHELIILCRAQPGLKISRNQMSLLPNPILSNIDSTLNDQSIHLYAQFSLFHFFNSHYNFVFFLPNNSIFCIYADYNILYLMWLFDCGRGKQDFNGRHSFEVFDRLSKQNHQECKKSAYNNDSWIQRMPNTNPLSSFNPPNSAKQFDQFTSGNLSTLVKKKILKSEYDSLIQKHKNSKDLWIDKHFPPNNKSWGNDKRPVIWKRISQIIPNAKFAQNNFSPQDIIQGQMGDCYFLSAIAGIAQKPYRIKKIFSSFEINKNGIYTARLTFQGIYQQVVVDDFFPVDPQDGSLQGAKPAGGNQIWVMILQKCWAKLCGSYQRLSGGVPDEVLRAFSSAPTYNYSVAKYHQNLQFLWGKLIQSEQKGQIMCCGTYKRLQEEDWKSIGLVPSHAYTILNVYEGKHRLLKIRNPWGSVNTFEWNGKANQKDNQFWQKISTEDKSKMDFDIKQDGTFFMLWQDFQKYFLILTICKIYDNAHYFYQSETFEKKIPILYEIVSEGGQITFIATQKNKRDLNHEQNQKFAKATLIIAKVNQNNSFQYITSKNCAKYSETYLSYNLPKGKYILCCFLQGKMDKTKATISIYTQSNASFINSSIDREEFLHLLFLNHARNSIHKHVLNQNPQEWCLWNYVKESNIVYFAIHLSQKSTTKAGLQFDQTQLSQYGLSLLPPNDGAGTFTAICDIGHELIILCQVKYDAIFNEVSVHNLPNPIKYRLKLK